MSLTNAFNIRTLVLIVTLIPLVLACVILAPYFLVANKSTLDQALLERGQTALTHLSHIGEIALISGDIETAEKLMQQLLDQQEEICGITLRDLRGLIIFDRQKSCTKTASITDLQQVIMPSTLSIGTLDFDDDLHLSSNSQRESSKAMVRAIGSVGIKLSKHLINRQQQQFLLNGLILTGIAFLISLLIGYYLSRHITNPLAAIITRVKAISKGHYSQSRVITVSGEIGELANNIEQMASNLDDHILELTCARENAETANAEKTEFLALISHEVRTPLNVSMGMLEILKDTKLNDLQKRYVRNALESSEHLVRLMDDILDFSTLNLGKIKFQNEGCDLVEITGQVIENFSLMANRKGLVLTLHHDDPENLKNHLVVCDPTRIKQILINLIGNAIKYTARGAVDVTVAWKKMPASQLSLTISIKDTGCGIPKHRLKEIFTAFKRGEPIAKRTQEGCGLGLAITQYLVNGMEGELSVSSQEGLGSLFQCQFNFDYLTVAKSISNDIDTSANPISTGRVLLVEDNFSNRETFTLLMQHYGIDVDTANNADEAMEKFYKSPYDIIFIDYHLPKVDGIELAENIRSWESSYQSDRIRRTPLIAITADVQQTTKQKCFNAGMDDFIAKPVRKFDLYKKTSAWIATGKQLHKFIQLDS